MFYKFSASISMILIRKAIRSHSKTCWRKIGDPLNRNWRLASAKLEICSRKIGNSLARNWNLESPAQYKSACAKGENKREALLPSHATRARLAFASVRLKYVKKITLVLQAMKNSLARTEASPPAREKKPQRSIALFNSLIHDIHVPSSPILTREG